MAHDTNLNNLKRYFFDESTTEKFVKFLMTKASVFAPQQNGEKSYSYNKVNHVKDIVYNYPRTIQPLKKFFLPPRETLLNFNINKNEYEKQSIPEEKCIFFAIHSYEMQGVKRLDYSFSQGSPESNYFSRRENSLFIGISYTPDKYHFSKSLGIEIEELDGFCLFFEPTDNGYLVFEVDDAGKELIAEFGNGFVVDTQLEIEVEEKPFEAKIKYHYNRLPQVFEHVYFSKVWDEVAKRCVGCGTCNLLCSTCYCFDVRDEVNLDIENGERQRFWDGCMLNQFAEVAGGENFRDKISNRTRHRLYRKFKYITDSSGKLHCVGCGRCSKFCPAKINIVEIINDLIEDYSRQEKV